MKNAFRHRLASALFLVATIYQPTMGRAEEPSIQLAFAPHAGATEAVVSLIGEAHETIRLAAYNFTSKDIARALLDAKKRGVDVKVVLDRSNAKARYSSAKFLAHADIPIRIDYKYAIMHNKFIVVDGDTVETGSFNYTSAAENKNAENVIILRNYPELAERYDEQWEKLWNESVDAVN